MANKWAKSENSDRFHFLGLKITAGGDCSQEIKRPTSLSLSSSSSLVLTFCHKGVSSAYLRLLIFLPEILIPACASFILAYHMMYSAYKLNRQGDNIQLWCTPFLIRNQSVVSCPVLTVDSWLIYRFLKRHVRWSGIPMSLRIFQFFVTHTDKVFGIVNKA